MVWDLPAIGQGMQQLRSSRVSGLYNELATSVEVFAQLFGRALQAQVGSRLGRAIFWLVWLM